MIVMERKLSVRKCFENELDAGYVPYPLNNEPVSIRRGRDVRSPEHDFGKLNPIPSKFYNESRSKDR